MRFTMWYPNTVQNWTVVNFSYSAFLCSYQKVTGITETVVIIQMAVFVRVCVRVRATLSLFGCYVSFDLGFESYESVSVLPTRDRGCTPHY